MNKENYFFYEWLILDKKITEEQFKQLTSLEFNKFMIEYKEFKKGLK